MLTTANHFFLLLMMQFCCRVGSATSGSPCAKRKTNDGFVCVCNATYCDTIQKAEKPPDFNVYVQYTTSKAGKVYDVSYGLFNKPDIKDRGCHITINSQERYQEIYGLGGSFTDSVGINIASLSEGAQYNLLSSYFGENGSQYNFIRVPMGGSDFSTHPYTLADEANDLNLDHFNLTEEDHKYKIPYIKMAIEMSEPRPVLPIGSAWSAPVWMKTNNKITGFGFLKKQYYHQWAQYHVKFLEAYKSSGIQFWAITTGNEPLNALIYPIVKFNSMGWNPKNQGKWVVKHLGPLMRKNNFESVKIMAVDDQRLVLPFWIHKMFSVKNATDYVDGFSVHWYYDRAVPATVLSNICKKHPNKFIINTEACEGFLPFDKTKVALGSWHRGGGYMDNIIEDLEHCVSAWVDWNLALDMKGGPNWVENFVDSTIIVNAAGDEFYKQPMFYALGHFSKFINPHAIKIGLELKGCKDIAATPAHNQDGSVVIVIHNRGKPQKRVILEDPIKGKAVVNLESKSFNTIMYWYL